MQEHHSQLVGLTGFIVAGLIFVASGVRSGDALVVAGSFVWTASCVVWLVPILRLSRQ